MRVLADVYARSPNFYRGLQELTPYHDSAITAIENPFGPKVLLMSPE